MFDGTVWKSLAAIKTSAGAFSSEELHSLRRNVHQSANDDRFSKEIVLRLFATIDEKVRERRVNAINAKRSTSGRTIRKLQRELTTKESENARSNVRAQTNRQNHPPHSLANSVERNPTKATVSQRVSRQCSAWFLTKSAGERPRARSPRNSTAADTQSRITPSSFSRPLA